MLARISIIVPVLNEAAGLERMLGALANLRRRGCEVIVVDGGSRDDTVRIARAMSDLVIASPPGRARQMNAGAARARAEILLFLHADTFLPPNADDLIIERLQNSGLAWGRFDVRLSGRNVMFRLIETMMNWRSRLSGIATGDQAIFVRSEIFKCVGGYREIPLMEDIALSRSLKRYSRPLCLRAKLTTSSRRWETRGICSTIFLMWRLRLRYALGADAAKLARDYQ